MNSKETKEQDQDKNLQNSTEEKLYGDDYIFRTTAIEKCIWTRTEHRANYEVERIEQVMNLRTINTSAENLTFI